jgi:hypothetical protein
VEEDTVEAQSKRDKDPDKQGVALGRAKHGICIGVFEFPRLDLWTVEFIVSKREPRLKDQGSPSDAVTIRLGASTKSLTNIGTYKNVVNEDTLSITYEISYQIKSKTLAYRFEFESLTDDPDVHITILPGVYMTKVTRKMSKESWITGIV